MRRHSSSVHSLTPASLAAQALALSHQLSDALAALVEEAPGRLAPRRSKHAARRRDAVELDVHDVELRP